MIFSYGFYHFLFKTYFIGEIWHERTEIIRFNIVLLLNGRKVTSDVCIICCKIVV